MTLFRLACAALLALVATASAASAAPAREAEWTAPWIAHPDAPADGAGVYHFVKAIDLAAKPGKFVVRVSADNRYRLFVNGRAVLSGPARGDAMHWRYETADLAAWLKPGRNVIAALVWNWGDQRPVAQMSVRTGFLLQGEGAAEVANSGSGWRVLRNPGYAFAPVVWPDSGGYYVAGPGETIDGRAWPWGWETGAAEGAGWVDAQPIVVRSDVPAGATPRGSHMWGEGGGWQLVPRNIPAMEERPIRFARVRRAEGVRAGDAFLRGRGAITVPPRTRASLLLDQGELTMGYPMLVASGGAGARATLTYAEALYDKDGNKGHRDEIEGKTIRGVRDVFLFEGGDRRRYQPLWLRAWRYVQIHVETAAEPLRIDDVRATFTAYPFEQRAAFAAPEAPWIADVWEMDWRVFRLSAFETFWDTPYYEQLQYVGDTRIESLLSLYNAGDDRLMKNAIAQFDHSRIPEGITASRYPSALPQYIPPFSLWWTAMVHDHWMHRGDADFARRFIPGVRGVLAWYERHVDASGMLGPMPWWNFLDWSPAYERGVPPGAVDGNSTPLTLQFVYALQRAAELEEALGQPAEGARYRALAARLVAAVRARAWDEARGLFADTPDKKSFGQQANALALLTGAVPAGREKAAAERMLDDPSLIQASFYFRFYVDEALREAGLADRYLGQLEPWREMLRMGLTTTPENPEPTRSDSHAWSAHPNYHLLATLLGIRPAEPGFRTVRIAPALGALRSASGKVPHPAGSIEVRFERRGRGGLIGEVILPPGVSGELLWAGRRMPLQPGKQRIRL